MSRKNVFYNLLQLDRIGQVADEFFALKNLYPRESHDIHVTCLPPHSVKNCNHEFFEIASRDVNLMFSTDVENLKQFHENKGEVEVKGDDTYVFLHPTALRIAAIEHFVKVPPKHFFSFSASEEKKGLAILEHLGIPADAPIVTLHVRDGGFTPGITHNNYRNADIANYLPATEFLLEEGYTVIRLGDTSMNPLTLSHPRLIDAPFMEGKTGFWDPYLVSKSRFYLGCPSGPSSVALGFQVPILYTDTPIFLFCWNRPHDMWLYKKVFSEELDRELTYREILADECIRYYHGEAYEKRKMHVVDNSSVEILEATKEMHQKTQGSYQRSESDIAHENHVRAQQARGHEIAQERNFFFCFYLQEFNIADSFMRLNPDFFELPSTP